MSLTFIAGFLLACVPAVFLGVNNGATLLGALVMAFSAVKILRGRA